MKNSILTSIVIFITFTSTVFSQPQFSTESRFTDIIVKVERGVLELPQQLDQALPAQFEIGVPELSRFIARSNVQLVLRSFPEVNPADTLLVNEFGHEVRLLDRSRIYRLRFPSGTELEEVVKELQNMPGIIFAETIPPYEFDSIVPDDPHFASRQWNLHHTGQGFQPAVTNAGRADVRAPEAWAIYTGSPNVNIGIIDSGVRLTHEDLSGKVSGDSHTSSSHGTHVAGIAAAQTNNQTGIAGIDWNAQIISRNVEGFQPETIYNAILSALNEGTHILNNSWSGPQYNTLIASAFATAYSMNALSVATTGNTQVEETRYPGALSNVMAIGASNHQNQRAGYSTFGNHIDVVAPGGGGGGFPATANIYSTWATGNNAYTYANGTSMAAPHVAGIASLLRGYGMDELNKTLYNDDIRNIIRLSADKVRDDLYTYDANGWNIQMGYGRVNAYEALKRLQSPYVLNHHSVTGGTVHSTSSNYTKVFYNVPGLSTGTYIVRRFCVQSQPKGPFLLYLLLHKSA